MADEDKTELFKHSETLKDHAFRLFEGKEPAQPIYALVHAASTLIKEGKGDMSYKEANMKALAILLHLQECSGCEGHKE